VNKVDLSVIILSYNTQNFLQDCLRSIEKVDKKGLGIEIIVVDNASQDDSAKVVKKDFPQVKLMVNKKNLGFSAGNNRGIAKASGKYVLILNPDTIMEKETIASMYQYMEENPNVGASTCRIELPNGKLDLVCHRGFPTPWRAFCHFSGLEKLFPKSKYFSGYVLGHLPLNKVHPIDSGTGAFLFVRKKAGEEINWFDEDYFWYGEDLDFCYRLKQKNWRVMYVPITKILHYRGASSGILKHSKKISTASLETRTMAARASTEAMRIFYNKHYRQKYPLIITSTVLLTISLLERLRLLKSRLG
jgi:GT2 family glycosyltransferase